MIVLYVDFNTNITILYHLAEIIDLILYNRNEK